ncbi:OLC1v1032085C1 [Oldenlandia corymbosa var. corymbosa]|uniref:OLC1v1032085C1 n=1 Tax=Oldenlandia corymbosa var. corymbosa TaxID=529605 RepID=A0AAV1CLQ7_OLDCO|nr:OLC1v1032085C1 [Oldenlandia corymbosa var. corymbosa]
MTSPLFSLQINTPKNFLYLLKIFPQFHFSRRKIIFFLKKKMTEEKGIHLDDNSNGGWQEVTYGKKKQNKKKPVENRSKSTIGSQQNGNIISDRADNVFASLEKNSEQRPGKTGDRKGRQSKMRPGNGDDDHSKIGKDKENGTTEGKEKKNKKKPKKEMKNTNMTVEEAAKKIDANDLSSFLADNSASNASSPDIQLMRFADYFGRAFSAVNAAQFPWLNMLKESTLDEVADMPICHVPQSVCKISTEWISQRSDEALATFVLWALDSILGDLTTLKTSSKAQKKVVNQTSSSNSQVAMFLVISMTLRQRPEVMINLLPVLRTNSKYHGPNKLPIFTWKIIQASHGDLSIGMYLWAHFVLPYLGGKSNSNTQIRELVLQLVERILSRPNAKKILVNGAVRKGERLVPPSALDLLLHVTFPTSSTKIKENDGFETIYPIIVYVALAGTPRSKSIKQLSLEIQDVALKATVEGNPKLSEEAHKLLVWCLTQNTECYKKWENVYANNLETSIAILKKLIQRWSELSPKMASQEALSDTIKIFRKKNEEAFKVRMEGSRKVLYAEAEKYCKVLLKKMFWDNNGWPMFKLSIIIPMVAVFAYIYGYKEYSRTIEFLLRNGGS